MTRWLMIIVPAAVILTLLIAVPVSLVFLGKPFTIPSGSMIPTLLIGDRILVDQFVYRHKGPKRGDVVVFKDKDFFHVARVVGLPPDTVEVLENGHLRLNNQDIDTLKGELLNSGDQYYQADEDDLQAPLNQVEFFEEHVGNHVYRVILTTGVPRNLYKFAASGQPLVVPSGTVFVLGDNRDNARDSRYIGPIPIRDIVGEVKTIWWNSRFRLNRFSSILREEAAQPGRSDR